MSHHHQCCGGHGKGECCSHGSEDHSCCHDSSCHECHHHHEKGDFAKELLQIADDAWMEVLKHKIKEQIIASSGSHLDELAKIVAESNRVRWKHKMGVEKTNCEYTHKVAKFFSCD